jgi:hypothetical protein
VQLLANNGCNVSKVTFSLQAFVSTLSTLVATAFLVLQATTLAKAKQENKIIDFE